MSRDNHQDIVQRVYNAHAPEHTAESVLAFAVRVIAALPRDERAGLLRKDAGENIVNFHGVMVSAGRLCYPDGQLYKIATDIPATNAPVWNDDGQVDTARYFDIAAFLDPVPSPVPVPAPAPTSDPPSTIVDWRELDRLDALLASVDRIVEGLTSTRDAIVALGVKIGELEAKGIPAHLRF